MEKKILFVTLLSFYFIRMKRKYFSIGKTPPIQLHKKKNEKKKQWMDNKCKIS